jgi:hypothetical protein
MHKSHVRRLFTHQHIDTGGALAVGRLTGAYKQPDKRTDLVSDTHKKTGAERRSKELPAKAGLLGVGIRRLVAK